MSKLIELSEQGFGVHTFEITICKLSDKEYDKILERIEEYSFWKNDHYIVRTPKNSGFRIMIYNYYIYPSYIKVIVNPSQLLGDNDPCHLMNAVDKERLRTKLDSILKENLGNEFGLSRFQLTRIDCTVDFVTASSELTTEYIKLVSRSIRLNNSANTFGFYSNCEYGEEEKPKNNAKHCFRIANKGYYSFTVYDKLYDLIDKCHYENKPYPFGIMRFELALMHRKISVASDELGNNDIFELIEYITRNSERYLKTFVSHKLVAGDFYKYSSAEKLIEEKGIKGKIGRRLLWLLSMSIKVGTYNELMFIIENKLKSNAKLRYAKEHMRDLNINPIALPEAMTFNADILPGIHTIFGIERSSTNE